MADSSSTKKHRQARAKPKRKKTPRLSGEDRKAQIIREAADFFAHEGLNGSTLKLAKRLGITQPALYNHFISKDDLISQVLEYSFPSAEFYPRWRSLLEDESIQFRERLKEFYFEYAEAVFSSEILRLSLWSALSGTRFETKYVNTLIGDFFPRIIQGLKAELGDKNPAPVTEHEIELLQLLHGSIYYVAVRRWLLKRSLGSIRPSIAMAIDLFLEGSLAMIRQNSLPKQNAPGNDEMPTKAR